MTESFSDPQSWYQHALDCDRGGREEAARYALIQATLAGHADAQLQLALWLLTGRNGKALPGQAARLLVQLGDPFSIGLRAALYARGLGVEQSWSRAVALLIYAARGGLARAITQLGLMTRDDRDRSLLLRLAAGAGDPVATGLLDDPARGISDEALVRLNGSAFWHGIGEQCQMPHQQPLPAPKACFSAPRIDRYQGALDPLWCRYLALAAEPFLTAAMVNDARDDGQTVDHTRTNSAMSFHVIECDVLVQSINERLARLAALPVAYGEPLSILHYRPGQEYRPHYDFFDPGYSGHAAALRDDGQRIRTVLVYLSDDYAGGSTHFPKLDRRFKGSVGDAMSFSNVDQHGQPDRATLHAGEPPTAGEKWLASKWFRDRSQR